MAGSIVSEIPAGDVRCAELAPAPASPAAPEAPVRPAASTLERSSKVAVAKYAWSGRERLGLLRARDDVIVLHAMRWPDEIRDPAELLPPPVEVSEDEIEGALALMETMVREDLEGDDFKDTYTEGMAKIIEAKRAEKPLPEAPKAGESGQVLDLMAALTESVSKAARGDEADVHEMPKPKKTAAEKQATKKTTAKKTPTRKRRSA
ncbi:Ku protein [Streptomyces sp. NPDC006172]|uniref:Ku protein n=1 Tax=Streptomyces sp. NPDC006172 TaxID=3154470 RepID=UPI0033D65210